MPQGPGGGSGGDPGQAAAIQAALAASGYNVPLSFIQNKLAGGFTGNAQQFFSTYKGALEAFKGGGGPGDPPPTSPPGTTGGSGGSSGGSGSSGPDPKLLRDSYLQILDNWHLAVGKGGLSNLVEHAVATQMTSFQFMQAVKGTKAYKQFYNGINSHPGMSEGTYQNMYEQFRDRARDIGRPLTKAQFGTMLRKGLDFKEFNYRVEGIELIKKNKDVFEWWRRELVKRGELKPNKPLSFDQQWKIVTRQNTQEFEKAYQSAFLMGNLQRIGVDLKGADKEISRKRIVNLINQFEGGAVGNEIENLTTQDFNELAEQARTQLPASRLYGYGVNTGDLLEMKLGGRNAPKIAERVRRALSQAKSATEDKANSQLVQTEKGTKLLSGGLSSEGGY